MIKYTYSDEKVINVNKQNFKKYMGVFCTMLIAVSLLCGCSAGDSKEPASFSDSAASQRIGEGESEFCVEVVGADKAKTSFVINTNDKTVGEALLNLGFIDGEQGPYGLYVKTVNGITLDYDKDKMYWTFYINGEYASKGVDETEIEQSCIYSFRAEK